jgi:hypothetical protein
LKIRGEKEKKKRFQLLPAVENDELSRGTIIFKTKNTPPIRPLNMHGSLSQLCVNFSSPTKNIQFPSIFKAHVGEKEKKTRSRFVGHESRMNYF